MHQKTIDRTLGSYSKCYRSHLPKRVVSKMWKMLEVFLKCGQNLEHVGNMGPQGSLFNQTKRKYGPRQFLPVIAL